MHVPAPDIGGPAGVSRRAFIGCCSALLAASSGCAGVSPHTRTAYALLSDPPRERYQPVLDALIESILPGPDAGFPVTATQVGARLLALFPLERDARFVAMQKALVLFDDTDLFGQALGPTDREELSLDAERRGIESAAALARSHAQDAAAYSRFSDPPGPSRFTSLSLERRRAYLDLWRASGYLLRRQFHASARSLVMISAYSMDAVWPEIHYEGPLLPPRPGRRT
jgi:hypothetical protein